MQVLPPWNSTSQKIPEIICNKFGDKLKCKFAPMASKNCWSAVDIWIEGANKKNIINFHPPARENGSGGIPNNK